MRAIKHTIEIKIEGIDGIQVWDNKRNPGASLRKLNKISAIVSFSRNRRTQSTGSSLPLQPTGSQSTCGSKDGSFRYMAKWDHELDEDQQQQQQQHQQQQQQQQQSSTIVLETNLHPIKKSEFYESKTFEVLVGFNRAQEFIVFAAAILTVNATGNAIHMRLPLVWKEKNICFIHDNARKFGLAKDACLHAQISVSNNTSE